jgi:hypothetical protein
MTDKPTDVRVGDEYERMHDKFTITAIGKTHLLAMKNDEYEVHIDLKNFPKLYKLIHRAARKPKCGECVKGVVVLKHQYGYSIEEIRLSDSVLDAVADEDYVAHIELNWCLKCGHEIQRGENKPELTPEEDAFLESLEWRDGKIQEKKN